MAQTETITTGSYGRGLATAPDLFCARARCSVAELRCRVHAVTPNHAFERTAASALRLLAVPPLATLVGRSSRTLCSCRSHERSPANLHEELLTSHPEQSDDQAL